MKYKLKDIVTTLGDGIHGTPIFDESGEYYFFNGNNIENGNLVIKSDTKKVNFEEYKKYKKDLNNRTILVSINGTIGKVGIYNNEKCILGKSACYFNVKEEVNRDYIKFLLMNRNFQEYIKNYSTGTTIKNMSLKAMREFEFELPIRSIQDKVAHILNSIERKIELNTHINNNLYELSSVLYKKWFGELNENNSVPFSQFDKLGKVVMGQSPKGESYNYNEDGVPLINGAADYEKSFLKAQKYTTMPTKICNRGDLIFCIRATIGLLTICDKKYCLGRGVAGITNIDEIYKEYSYHLIDSSIESFKRLATGSVIVGITRDDIQNIKVKVPSLNQIDNFHEIQKPIFQKAECIKEEIRRLSQLRDTLLPKLMNGEIDLDKIEI